MPGGLRCAGAEGILRLRGGAEVDPRMQGIPDPLRQLSNACNEGDTDTVAALVAQGADVNALCVEDSARLQFNALQAAAFGGSATVIHQLMGLGAQVNSANDKGYTALHFAALMGELGACKALVACGAEVGAVDMFGDQPVDRAEQAQRNEVVTYLVKAMNESGVERQWGGYDRPPSELLPRRSKGEGVQDVPWGGLAGDGEALEELLDGAERVLEKVANMPTYPGEVTAPHKGYQGDMPAHQGVTIVEEEPFFPGFMLNPDKSIKEEFQGIAMLVEARKKMIESGGREAPQFDGILEILRLEEQAREKDAEPDADAKEPEGEDS